MADVHSRPTDIPAERVLLGMLIEDPARAFPDVLDILQAEDFYTPVNGALFGLLLEMYLANEPITLDRVIARVIATDNHGTRFDSSAGICELLSHVVATTNAGHYARAVVRMARLRALFDLGEVLIGRAASRQDPDQIITFAMNRLTDVAGRQAGEEAPMTIGEAIVATERERAESTVRVVPTSFPDLDEMLGGGMKPGNLVVVAARPSMGKTGLALSMLLDHSLNHNRVGFLSLEMSRADISDRLVSQLSGVSVKLIQQKMLNTLDHHAVDVARQELERTPFLLHAPPKGATMGSIVSTCRRWVAEGGVDVLAIDYLSLVKHEMGGKIELRDAIGQTAKQCKQLGKELGIPVILLVQLNRDYARNRPAASAARNADWWDAVGQPQLHHLADSGEIERDADVVLFPMPAQVLKKQGYAPNLNVDPREAVIMVAKNRNGPIGAVRCSWSAPTASYHALAPKLRVVGGSDIGDAGIEEDESCY